ncbi:MAG: cell division protein ZapA [Candidatus Cloacimonetes bacterium]|nr:cell division protein ZapA [Candidatus Cloacimonadota bacterium]MCF7814597.1 cell division protein ZapA [Candidatus Cloacimonadota bacterium]MCF7869077.1 cell division protein ZapA [Candidatus Cloacimonadota bacterium]MCF7884494.1 cell division protein ZapA [Candidatus Cloacimonadota bacterium]
MKSVEVELLGKKYFFKSDNPEQLQKTAKYLEEQLDKLNDRFNTVDQMKLYVMYSLMMTQKYFTEKEKYKKLIDEFEQASKRLEGLGLE